MSDKEKHVDIRCNKDTLAKWQNLFYEKKRKGWDAEQLFNAMIDTYVRTPEGHYF